MKSLFLVRKKQKQKKSISLPKQTNKSKGYDPSTPPFDKECNEKVQPKKVTFSTANQEN